MWEREVISFSQVLLGLFLFCFLTRSLLFLIHPIGDLLNDSITFLCYIFRYYHSNLCNKNLASIWICVMSILLFIQHLILWMLKTFQKWNCKLFSVFLPFLLHNQLMRHWTWLKSLFLPICVSYHIRHFFIPDDTRFVCEVEIDFILTTTKQLK